MKTLTLTDHAGRKRSISFPASTCKGSVVGNGTRLTRCIWLAATVLTRGHLDFDTYRERFNVSLRTYYRDLGALHDIGFCLVPERTGSAPGRVSLESLNLNGPI